MLQALTRRHNKCKIQNRAKLENGAQSFQMLLATQVISQLFSSVVMKSTDSDLCWTDDNVGNLNQCVSIHATSLVACAQSITGVYDPPPIILHCSSNEKL